MNRKLNRRGAPLHHLIIPPTDAVSPISSADKLDSTFMINCLRGCASPFPSPASSSGKAARRSPLESLRYGGGKVVDDEVLVMDGVLVATADSGSSSSSAGGGRSGSRKGELCRSWEDLGHCRHGSKCQFAHGKEEICPSCLPVKKKQEAPTTHRSYMSGSPLHGLKCHFPLGLMAEGAGYGADFQKSILRSPGNSLYSPTISMKSGSSSKKTRSTDKCDSSGGNPASNISNQTKSGHRADARSADDGKLDANSSRVVLWSPFDDGIEVTLPDQVGIFASREDIDAHINGVLYGPATRKRLPVFIDIYSE